MSLTPKEYLSRGQKVADFALGLVANFIINAAMGAGIFILTMFQSDATYVNTPPVDAASIILKICSCFPWLINLGMLIFLLIYRKFMGLGWLAAIAIGFLLVLCLALIFGAACFAFILNPNSFLAPTPTSY